MNENGKEWRLEFQSPDRRYAFWRPWGGSYCQIATFQDAIEEYRMLLRCFATFRHGWRFRLYHVVTKNVIPVEML